MSVSVLVRPSKIAYRSRPSGSPLAFAWRLTLSSFLMDSSKCQTPAVSPAKPGDFSFLVNAWVAGATVGYGHLIKAAEWNLYKNGITEFTARTLFGLDLTPFVTAVRSGITSSLEQHQFDALVMLAFNIGAGANGFAGSSVVKMINDPTAKTNYPNLEAAWKAWNKSQGKVLKGLENRLACEWVVFSQGVYKKW
ncbi:lysozyme [Methylomonas sp. MED-D]|uniref:lysozyme n=1 Tax=unclassified Methylomonas TaxID=2608980 RepID=UPI0028A55488|nr:lysozyme [Methylomonas sp. MV1]MDT4330389.1 lysozyme [Methylomonas sp. MV1]